MNQPVFWSIHSQDWTLVVQDTASLLQPSEAAEVDADDSPEITDPALSTPECPYQQAIAVVQADRLAQLDNTVLHTAHHEDVIDEAAVACLVPLPFLGRPVLLKGAPLGGVLGRGLLVRGLAVLLVAHKVAVLMQPVDEECDELVRVVLLIQ